jgi:endonuclease-8
MEGPSLVIAKEDLSRFLKKEVTRSSGTLTKLAKNLRHKRLQKIQTWGKLLWLQFPGTLVRVHFLMFGSYRIINPREHRHAKLQLEFGKDKVYFYSCSVKQAEPSELKGLDKTADLHGKSWDGRRAKAKLRKKAEEEVCDLLMDQTIFAGLGNIMKNEILFRCRIHPESRFADLGAKAQAGLARDCRAYSKQFYAWKKKNVLKRNWQIMRKKKCPACQGPVTKRPTGKLARLSHFCRRCQVMEH